MEMRKVFFLIFLVASKIMNWKKFKIYFMLIMVIASNKFRGWS